jgi:hypothetical protein
VRAAPAAITSTAARARAVTHGEMRWRAAALTIGASVVPIRTAATTGRRMGRQK